MAQVRTRLLGARAPAFRVVAALLAIALVVLAALHLAGDVVPGRSPGFTNLDGERNLPTLYGALLLFLSGVTFLRLVRHRVLPRSTLPLVALLLVMAADEVLTIHERLERALDVDWQILYAPVVLLGALALVRVLRSLGPHTLARTLLLLGGGAWGASQALELAQWDGDVPRPGYDLLMFTEELLETAGSSLFLLCALVLLQGARASLGAGAGRGAGARPVPAVGGAGLRSWPAAGGGGGGRLARGRR